LDGIDIVPNSGVVRFNTDPKSQELYADNATVRLGSFTVYSGFIPTTLLTGSFELSTDNLATIGGLPLGGKLDVTATGQGELTIMGSVSLPAKLGSLSVALTVGIGNAGLNTVGVAGKNLAIPVGVYDIGLQDFSLSYNWVTDTWEGSATVSLPPSGAAVAGSIVITHGQVTELSVAGENLNLLLGDGVFLQHIGADVVIVPPPPPPPSFPSITGTAGVTAGPKISLPGSKTKFAIAGIDGSLGYTFSNPGDLQLTGSLTLVPGSPAEVQLASGELDYYINSHITVDGDISLPLGPLASINGSLGGWIDSTTAFEMTGSTNITIGPVQVDGATTVVSNIGIAACGQPFGDLGGSLGFGYTWGGTVNVMSSSCDLGPYTPSQMSKVRVSPRRRAAHRSTFSGANASQVGVPLPSNLSVASFAIAGNGTAPSGTLSDPEGHVLEIDPSKQGVFTASTPEYVLAVDPSDGVDYVAVDAPAGGAWNFTPAAGSSVMSIKTALGLPKPSVSATVSGGGRKFKLRWKVAAIPGQSVTFVEEGPDVDHVLATGITTTRGRVSFHPANGAGGVRTIVALVTQQGLARTTIPVATYSPPAAESLAVGVDASNGGGRVVSGPRGISCGSACFAFFPQGTAVKLTPKPQHGSKFIGWSQGICKGMGPCRVTLTQGTAVTALFGPKSPKPHRRKV